VAIVAIATALAVAIGAGTAYALGLAGHHGNAATGVPEVTFGSYTGRRPAAIVLDKAVGGTIQGIRWTSWTATRAAGAGHLGTVPTEVTLSDPVDGRFTHIGETSNGETILQAYPGDEWPAGASPAAAAACMPPTAVALVTAWRSAPASVRQGWAASGAAVKGFTDIQCWKNWVVANAIGNGDGSLVFSRSGRLHLIPESNLQQFSDDVCSDPTAPRAWKSQETGPAIC
jgi:hypothetical protein